MSLQQYDIFISYRREGGFETAQLLYDRLTRCGYKVFFDLESLRSGKFNEQLYTHISSCKDYIVVLNANAIQWRENRDDDWLRLEMAHALQGSCNIIPVFLRDFKFPAKDEFPDDIAEIVNYEGITSSVEHFDSTMQRICRNLRSKPRGIRRKLMAVLLIAAAVICAASGIYIKRDTLFPYPFTRQQKQDFNLLYHCMLNHCQQYDQLADNTGQLLEAAAISAQTGKNRRFQEQLQLFKHNLSKIEVQTDLFTLERVSNTPVDMDDFVAIPQIIDRDKIDAAETAAMLDGILSSGVWTIDDLLAYIKIQQKLLQQQNEFFAICIMAVFSKIPDSALEDFKRQLAPWLPNIPFPAGKWLKTKEEIDNTFAKNIEQTEKLVGEIQTFLGNHTFELRSERAAAIAEAVADGMTQVEAEEFIDSLLAGNNNDTVLAAKRSELEEAQNSLEDSRRKLRN